ncbi:hypothetical protein BDW60DRAFT_23261 [Aspergillus nidulans var. acristatus]
MPSKNYLDITWKRPERINDFQVSALCYSLLLNFPRTSFNSSLLFSPRLYSVLTRTSPNLPTASRNELMARNLREAPASVNGQPQTYHHISSRTGILAYRSNCRAVPQSTQVCPSRSNVFGDSGVGIDRMRVESSTELECCIEVLTCDMEREPDIW